VRIRQAAAEEGPNPRQAVAEALSAVNALAEMGLWPGPRDPASEAAVIQVRERWARIQSERCVSAHGDRQLQQALRDLVSALGATGWHRRDRARRTAIYW
jgi:hypothetical protein